MIKTAAALLLLSILLTISPAQAATDTWIKKAYERSLTNEKIEDYSGAIKALAKVVAIYPKGYIVNLRLGWLYYLSGRYANSITHYQTARIIQPEALEPLLGAVLPLMAQTDYVRAKQVVNQLLQIDPGNYFGNLRLIEILQHTGKQQQALSICLRMRKRYPTDIFFLQQHGAILQAQNREVEAVNIYHTLLTIDPDNTPATLFFTAYVKNEGDKK